MQLPSIIDVQAIVGIGMLSMIVTQYIKGALPDKMIPVCNLIIAIWISFLWYYKPGEAYPDMVMVVANGMLGASGADTGYNFLSASSSPPFSLPRKNGNGEKK